MHPSRCVDMGWPVVYICVWDAIRVYIERQTEHQNRTSKQNIRVNRRLRTMSRHKLKSQALCGQQNSLCALCEQPIPQGPNQMCYYEPRNVVVCRTCNTTIHNYVRLREPGGVTIANMEAFLTCEPAPEPITHKKLSLEQIKGRYHVAAGQVGNMTLADYDARVGSSGSVIVPDGKPLLVDEVMEHTGECTGE